MKSNFTKLSLFALVVSAAVPACKATQTAAPAPEAAPAPVAPVAAVEQPAPEATPVSSTVTAETTGAGEPTAFDPIYFDFDSSEFLPGSEQTLQAMADYLLKNPTATLVIGGHSDERGTPEYNLALADRRARKARDYLSRLGVNAERVNMVPYGEERPAVMGNDETAWSKNRRDEFEIGTR